MGQKRLQNEKLVGDIQRLLNREFNAGLNVDEWGGDATRRALARHIPAFKDLIPSSAPLVPQEPGMFREQVIISPNRSTARNEAKHLILHHCGGWAKDGNPRMGTLSHVLNPSSGVSYHCLIAWDGTRTILCPYEERAYHAGASSWKGRSGCNAFTIGVAFGGDTVSGARRPGESRHLTETEIDSYLEWVRPLVKRFGWTREDIITHRQVSPGRRNDVSQGAQNQIIRAMVASGMIQ